MEFTKLFKYGSASLFLVLLVHGLVLSFSTPTTILSVVLLLVCFAMEQKLVLHEREQVNTKIEEILTRHRDEVSRMKEDQGQLLTQLHDRYGTEQKELLKKLEAVHSQLNTLKTGIGMRKL
jgi:uncharacterized protein HemX